MHTLSLCLITKDESGLLARCLQSVLPAVDEIIIVDTGSRDNTVEIARQFTDKVYHHQWRNDFALARNIALEHATADYQLWLDADDVLPEGELEKLLALKPDIGAYDFITMPYVLSASIADVPLFCTTRKRILKRKNQYRFVGNAYEDIYAEGHTLHSGIALVHQKPAERQGDGRYIHYLREAERNHMLRGRGFFFMGRDLMEIGQFEEARPYLERFLAGNTVIDDFHIFGCIYLSQCLGRMGQFQRAEDILQREMNLSKRAELRTAMGHILFDKGEYRQAAQWYQRALQAALPRHDRIIDYSFSRDEPCSRLALCLAYCGDAEGARVYEAFADKLSRNPGETMPASLSISI